MKICLILSLRLAFTTTSGSDDDHASTSTDDADDAASQPVQGRYESFSGIACLSKALRKPMVPSE
jgi:hypothetical protein